MDAKALEKEALAAIEGAETTAELDDVRVRYLGRKSDLKQALREVRDRESGMTLNAAREAIEAAVAAREEALRTQELNEALATEQLDVTLPGSRVRRGRLHLLTQIRREVEDIFLGLGYQVVDGDEVEDSWHLFDALNMGPAHVTRSPLHTLFLDGDTVLRTETSASQIRVMEKREPPVYMVSLGRVYRRDTIEHKNYPIFHQCEGLAVDEGITVADLKGTLLHLCRALFGEEQRVRFVTDFFPFTEPSAEIDMMFTEGPNKGRWLEISGSGQVHPTVVRNYGFDPERYVGFAFGSGLERLSMLRYGINDLRLFFDGDLRFLRQFN
jgi:phenylalanyl-tRNA synthetase alpha chain